MKTVADKCIKQKEDDQMSFIEPKDLKKLKEIDLLTYLSNYEPERLKKISRNTFCIRDHDSLHISIGLWH